MVDVDQNHAPTAIHRPHPPLSRLTRAADGHGDTTGFGYDPAGNQTTITWAHDCTTALVLE